MQTSSENVKSRLIAIAAFASVCWVLAVAVYAFMATGRIFCANPVKYAGRITPDENGKITFTEEFILNNRGFRDIEIQTVESSCGCTKIVYPNKIPKFSSAKIVAHVSYDADTISRRRIDIAVVNSSKDPVFELKSESEPGNYFTCETSEFNFGAVYSGDTATKTAMLWITDEIENTPSANIESESKHLKIGGKIENQKIYEFADGSQSKLTIIALKAVLKAPEKEGAYMEGVFMEVRGSKTYRVEIPAKWNVIPNARFARERYYFSKNQNEISVALSFNRKAKTVKSAKTDNPAFEIANIGETVDGIELGVRLKGSAETNSEALVLVEFEDGTEVSAKLIYAR